MKRILLFTSLLGVLTCVSVMAQSGQSPAVQQSTSATDTHQPQPKLKKNGRSGNQKMQSTTDTTMPKNRKQRRLAPDSLRRGGATRVDTVR